MWQCFYFECVLLKRAVNCRLAKCLTAACIFNVMCVIFSVNCKRYERYNCVSNLSLSRYLPFASQSYSSPAFSSPANASPPIFDLAYFGPAFSTPLSLAVDLSDAVTLACSRRFVPTLIVCPGTDQNYCQRRHERANGPTTSTDVMPTLHLLWYAADLSYDMLHCMCDTSSLQRIRNKFVWNRNSKVYSQQGTLCRYVNMLNLFPGAWLEKAWLENLMGSERTGERRAMGPGLFLVSFFSFIYRYFCLPYFFLVLALSSPVTTGFRIFMLYITVYFYFSFFFHFICIKNILSLF